MAEIEGVRIRDLTTHRDDRGSLTELLRSDWSEFTRFGQVILTVNLPGVVRGWHAHEAQADVIVVVSGRMVIALYDPRDRSPSRGAVSEHLADGKHLFALFVPPGVFHGYKTLGDQAALVINIPDRLYDNGAPDEIRLPPDSRQIPYDWSMPH